MEKQLIKILSIDGGGIRGIIPAMILQQIESKKGKRIFELFDLIAGTSTGGIIALGLTKPKNPGGQPYEARELVELYEKEGRNIFKTSWWRKLPVFRRLPPARYLAGGVETTLKKYFGAAPFDNNNCLKTTLVTSYDTQNRNAVFFNSLVSPVKDGIRIMMKDVARATSAAPTFFPPLNLPVQTAAGATRMSLIDGGVFANNPGMCAYVEAQKIARQLYPDAEGYEYLLVSLGTGTAFEPMPYDEIIWWGTIRWGLNILGVMMDGQSDTVDHQLLNSLGDNYFRFQPKISRKLEPMDKADKENIGNLKSTASDYLRNIATQNLMGKMLGRL